MRLCGHLLHILLYDTIEASWLFVSLKQLTAPLGRKELHEAALRQLLVAWQRGQRVQRLFVSRLYTMVVPLILRLRRWCLSLTTQ
jgi:hypothetical protein